MVKRHILLFIEKIGKKEKRQKEESEQVRNLSCGLVENFQVISRKDRNKVA